MDRILKAVVLALSLCLCLTHGAFCQEGPPGKQKAEQGDKQSDTSPFPTSEEIAGRFEREWGVPKNLFHEIEKSFLGQFQSESAAEKGGEEAVEKGQKSAILVLLLAIAEVSADERESAANPAERVQNVKKSAETVLMRLRTTSVGWGTMGHELGFEGTNQLMKVQRAILWEEPVPEEVRPLLEFQK